FAHHFHTDHPVFSCSKIEQKQLNTWVSFQSAEQPLLGQFSVSGNRRALIPVTSRIDLISRSRSFHTQHGSSMAYVKAPRPYSSP
ncbi:hypothetical protein ACTHGN_004561, partial [Pseudomonas putida]